MAHCRSPSPSHNRFQGLSNSRTPDPAFDPRLQGATPAHSLSLKHHRVRSSFELMKENEHESLSPADAVLIRPKSSPAASTAVPAATKNGVKSFMAPTISASSKAVSPSPRRKVLGERNHHDSLRSSIESLRSSVESVGSVAAVTLAKPAVHDGQGGVEKVSQRQDEAVHAPVDVNHAEEDPADPLTPAAIPPLDADPSLPPYDPETNFLSPRPRFLFYKPKSRQEMLQLEQEDQLSVDGASQKSGEDGADGSENIEDAKPLNLVENLEENKEAAAEKPNEATASSDDKPDLEQVPKKAAEIEKPDETEADLTEKPEEEEEEEEEEETYVVPRSSSSRPKTLPLVIITLFLACFIVPMDTPVKSSSFPLFVPFRSPAINIFERLPEGSPLRRAAGIVDANLRELSGVLRHWSANAYSNFQKWASMTAEGNDGWVLPRNFTPVVFHDQDQDFLLEDREHILMNGGGELTKAGVDDVSQLEDSLESYWQVEDTVSSEVKEEVGEAFRGEGTTEFTSPSHDGDQGGAVDGALQEEAVVHPDENLESPGDSSDGLDSTEDVKEPSGSHTAGDLVSSLTEAQNNTQILVVVSSVVLALLVILLSVYYIKQKRSPSTAATSKEADMTPLPEPSLLEPAQFETMQVESGPSEASSSVLMQQSAAAPLLSEFNLTKRTSGDDVRRDSTASSTTSFGSFTTYEKVSGKKGKSSKSNDEAMTPVRRSSRIRSQVTSPQES